MKHDAEDVLCAENAVNGIADAVGAVVGDVADVIGDGVFLLIFLLSGLPFC